MGTIWNNLFRREAAAEADSAAFRTAGGNYKENVVRVTGKESAMRIAAVYRAVNLISSGAAVLTLQYKRRNRTLGYFMPADKGAGQTMNYLISVRPNARMNSYTFFKNLVGQVLLTGNAVVIPKRDIYGQVEELILTSPGSVAYDQYSNLYTIADPVNMLSGTYTADQVVHIKNTSTDGGYWGMSTIRYAAMTLGIAATADKETERRFATGGRFKAILQNNKTLKGFGNYQDKELKKMGDALQQSLNVGDDILVVQGDGQMTPISMSSADMQFLESRKFTIREIARFFNIPPSKLMDDTNSNYKSTEMSNIQFYSEALQPIVTEIEREFNAKLVGREGWGEYKFVFDIRAIYALDLDSRAKWNKTRLETGQCSVNDLRREDDIAPVGGGDKVYLSVNFAPLGSEKLEGSMSGVEEEEGGQK